MWMWVLAGSKNNYKLKTIEGFTRTGRIGLHDQDDPRKVAFNFSRTFQLNNEMQNSLEELLVGQLDAYIKAKNESEVNGNAGQNQ